MRGEGSKEGVCYTMCLGPHYLCGIRGVRGEGE